MPDGSAVVGFPETATKNGLFSFQDEHPRGYSTNASIDGRDVQKSSADGVDTYTVTMSESPVTVTISFTPLDTVTFDPGIFRTNDEHVYGRFDVIGAAGVQTESVGQDGASFDYTIKTHSDFTWQIDNLSINSIYLNLPEERTEDASASTTLYADETGSCVATLSIINVETDRRTGNTVYTYRLHIDGAKENLRIDAANLNNTAHAEVIPTASEGITFVASGSNNGLNLPTSLSDGATYTFGLKDGYKDLRAVIHLLSQSGVEVDNGAIELDLSRSGSQVISYRWGNHRADIATLANNGDGTYTIKFNTDTNCDASKQVWWWTEPCGEASGITLQFLNITSTLETYGMKYNVAGGSGIIEDAAVYDVVDNATAVVTSEIPEAPEGQFFIGWKIQGDDTDALYFTGDTIDFTNNKIQKLVEGTGDGHRDGYLTLVAQYSDSLSYGNPTTVNVNV